MSKLKRGIAKVSTALAGVVAVLAPGLVLAIGANDLGSSSAGEALINPKATTTGSFSTIILSVLNIFLWIIGIVAVLYLLLAGFNYITAGGDDEKATAARKGIINAIIGIIIVVAAFYILSAASGAGRVIATGSGTV